MKLLILKGDAPRHNYFAAKLTEIPGVESLVISPKRLSGSRLSRMLKKTPKTFFARVGKYLVLSMMGWNKREAEFFGVTDCKNESVVPGINSPECIQAVERFSPDVIAVFGVPIVCDRIISVPRWGAFNLHGGISPQYKGGNTIFWPLYEGHPEMAGATIHLVVTKVDSGDIFAKIYPEITPEDDECSVSCKTFKTATDEFVRLIEWIRNHQCIPQGAQQEGESRLYLAKMRTFFVSIRGMKIIRRNLRNVNIQERITREYDR